MHPGRGTSKVFQDADRFTLVDAGVVDAPKFGALVLGVPGMGGAAERKDAFLGAAFFLIAARAAEGGVELVLVQRLLQRLGLHHVGVDARP